MYTSLYSTPSTFDDIILVADGDYLTGLYFIHSQEGRRYLKDGQEANLPVFQDTRRWLDCYFSGHQPNFTPRYRLENLTSFRKEVSEIMCTKSIRQDSHLRRDSHTNSGKTRSREDVSTSGGRCGRLESYLYNHSLPSGDGGKRQTHRLRRRHQQ